MEKIYSKWDKNILNTQNRVLKPPIIYFKLKKKEKRENQLQLLFVEHVYFQKEKEKLNETVKSTETHRKKSQKQQPNKWGTTDRHRHTLVCCVSSKNNNTN